MVWIIDHWFWLALTAEALAWSCIELHNAIENSPIYPDDEDH